MFQYYFSIASISNYFGANVVSYVSSPYSPTYSYGAVYILSSTEFRFDSYITGFSYYGTSSGTIYIYVISSEEFNHKNWAF